MNAMQNITCPKCGAEFPLTEAVGQRVREQLAAEFAQQRQQQNAALADRERKLEAQATQLTAREQTLAQTVTRHLEAERQKLTATAARQAQEAVSLELADLRSQVAQQGSKLQDAQAAELELRRQKRELEDARQNLDLELARRLDAERGQIADSVRQQTVEAERLKQAEKDLLIKGLQDQIASLKQRAEQGSMQLQGDTLEVTLEQDLRQSFPADAMVQVKNGERGADLQQEVRTNQGLRCGSILWEAKRAKNWSAGWVQKLKEDQRQAKAEVAVLVLTRAPERVRGIGQVDGVWVCEPVFACALAAALRQGLVTVSVQRAQDSGRLEKTAQLYEYLCGVEFRQHIEGIVESFKGLREQLGAEQRAFARQWKEREQHLGKALQHTAMLYGSIQGIAGRETLPSVQTLELPAPDAAVALPAE